MNAASSKFQFTIKVVLVVDEYRWNTEYGKDETVEDIKDSLRFSIEDVVVDSLRNIDHVVKVKEVR